MENINFVIIHGAYGTPQENWFPWLKKQLKKKGFNVQAPQFPTPERQTPFEWKKVFRREVGELDKNTILIGHSLGSAFILSLLEDTDLSIMASFLVSAFLGSLGLPEFDVVNAPFFEKEFDWKKIHRNAGKVFVYNSDDDPYVPLNKGYEIADLLETNLIVIPKGGHINASAGFTSFPQLLENIENVLT